MILLVVTGDAARACERAARDADVEVLEAESVTAARETLAERTPRAVVLDATMDGATALFRALRDGTFGDPAVPAVLLFTDSPPEGLPTLAFDEILVRPVRPDEVSDAIDRAESVGAYRDAVSRLYEQSREHATEDARPGDLPADIRAAREEADERLAPLMDRPGVVSSLLWTGSETEE
ncbi:MAG: hypothetical protein ABEJ68_06665 [Halobacteriaceae archaeon]